MRSWEQLSFWPSSSVSPEQLLAESLAKWKVARRSGLAHAAFASAHFASSRECRVAGLRRSRQFRLNASRSRIDFMRLVRLGEGAGWRHRPPDTAAAQVSAMQGLAMAAAMIDCCRRWRGVDCNRAGFSTPGQR